MAGFGPGVVVGNTLVLGMVAVAPPASVTVFVPFFASPTTRV
jgi:hypothetical protein